MASCLSPRYHDMTDTSDDKTLSRLSPAAQPVGKVAVSPCKGSAIRGVSVELTSRRSQRDARDPEDNIVVEIIRERGHGPDIPWVFQFNFLVGVHWPKGWASGAWKLEGRRHGSTEVPITTWRT